MSAFVSGIDPETIRKSMDALGMEHFVDDKTPKGTENGVDVTPKPKSEDTWEYIY